MAGTGKKGALLLSGIMMLGIACGCAEKTPERSYVSQQERKAQQYGDFLEFPYTLPDSGLVIEEVAAYQGPFWEDQSGDAVENVAAIMLYNPTERLVEFGAIVLEQAEEKQYFFVHQMPPKSRCLIAESNRKPCIETGLTECQMLCVRWDYPEFSREQVDYLGYGNGLTVINRDGRRLEHIKVWYKKYDAQRGCYLGGTVYCDDIYALSPGERITVQSKHYHSGDCRIVSIRLE